MGAIAALVVELCEAEFDLEELSALDSTERAFVVEMEAEGVTVTVCMVTIGLRNLWLASESCSKPADGRSLTQSLCACRDHRLQKQAFLVVWPVIDISTRVATS